MAGWYLAGPDAESSTNLERNEVARRRSSSTGDGFPAESWPGILDSLDQMRCVQPLHLP